MKTAILLATRKGDSLAVRFLLHAPFSEVLADFKDRVANDRGEPGYDSLEIWTGPPAKTASRLSSGGQDAAILIVPEGGLTKEEFEAIAAEWKSQLESARAYADELEVELETLRAKFLEAGQPRATEHICPPIQQLSDYLAGLTVEQISEQFGERSKMINFAEGESKESMITQVLAAANRERETERTLLLGLSDAELDANFTAADIAIPEGLSREEKIEILLNGPTISELPHNTQAGTGEGNLAGAQATSDEPELPLGGPPAGETPPADPPQPGSMSPARKRASGK